MTTPQEKAAEIQVKRQNLLESFNNLGLATLYMFLIFLIRPLAGATSGWVLGWIFDNAIYGVLQSFGLGTNYSLWELGLFFGFIGGLFTSLTIPRQ